MRFHEFDPTIDRERKLFFDLSKDRLDVHMDDSRELVHIPFFTIISMVMSGYVFLSRSIIEVAKTTSPKNAVCMIRTFMALKYKSSFIYAGIDA